MKRISMHKYFMDIADKVSERGTCDRKKVGCILVKDNGSICYCNTFPCWECFKAMINAGVKQVYYKDSYAAKAKDNVIKFSKELNIPVVKIT